jgi:hypothetical protein
MCMGVPEGRVRSMGKAIMGRSLINIGGPDYVKVSGIAVPIKYFRNFRNFKFLKYFNLYMVLTKTYFLF